MPTGGAGIPAVTWRIADGADLGFNLFDLADRLRTHGWLVPAYTLPADLQAQTVQRVIVRHGFSHELGAHFIADLKRELATLERHPPSASMTEAEAGGSRTTPARRADRRPRAAPKIGVRYDTRA